MFGAIGNTHWNIVNCTALCRRAETDNTGSGAYQKDATMDDFIHKSCYGYDNACLIDECICKNHDNEKLYFPLCELCYMNCNKRNGFGKYWLSCGSAKQFGYSRLFGVNRIFFVQLSWKYIRH